ncbi:hypothetical protein CRG98_017632 [Punica granatum]|uniref:Uncharacterized protein n=1 Tax=Punica granatum TaxID=22663 RepID=A0A2I0K2I5_PUNGR|nr:hypothetical protein CRG98_017632 [Punica granatum]
MTGLLRESYKGAYRDGVGEGGEVWAGAKKLVANEFFGECCRLEDDVIAQNGPRALEYDLPLFCFGGEFEGVEVGAGVDLMESIFMGFSRRSMSATTLP